MNHQTIIVLDFGGQYNQLIARRVRECGVYCEVKPYTTPLADLLAMKPIGFIFTGGPNSVYLEDAPHVDPALFDAGVPVLGICYGCQLIAHHLGGKVVAANDATAREYGKTETFFDTNCKLFKGLPEKSVTWMSHGDYMEKVPEGFSLVAHSDACPNVAICDETRGFYGVQYHPEVNHTEFGTAMIRNFLYEVCGATGDWTMGDYKNTAIAAVRERSAPAACCWRSPAAWTRPSWRRCWPRPSAPSSPAFLLTTASCASTRATRSRRRSRSGTSTLSA